jgi:hypothetical protein
MVESTNVRKIALAQRSTQGHQRPGARLIDFPIRRALHFGEHACLLCARVGRLAATTCGNGKGEEAALVEATHQSTDGVIAFLSCDDRGLGRGCSCSDRHQRVCSLDDIHAFDFRIWQVCARLALLAGSIHARDLFACYSCSVPSTL